MNQESVQITYLPVDEVAERPLGRRQIREFSGVPALVFPKREGKKTVLNVEAACGTAEIPAGAFLLSAGERGGFLIQNGATGEKCQLPPGREWGFDGICYRFYWKHGSVNISPWSLFLARFAKGCIVLFFVWQLWVMLGLPSLIFNTPKIWDGSYRRIQLYEMVESTAQRALKMNAKTPLARAILRELVPEMEARVRYIKAYDERLSRSQRRKMYEDTRRIQQVLERLETAPDFGNTANALDTEYAVKKLLEIVRRDTP